MVMKKFNCYALLGYALLAETAKSIALLAFLCLPVAEMESGFLLGNLHPEISDFFIFSGRWAFDVACFLSLGFSIFGWRIARRKMLTSALILVFAVPLPFLGRAWLKHVDRLVSYPPGYFSQSGSDGN